MYGRVMQGSCRKNPKEHFEKDCLVNAETLRTFLEEVKSMIKGRPLTSISNNINDMELLTPIRFLVGQSSPKVWLMYANGH